MAFEIQIQSSLHLQLSFVRIRCKMPWHFQMIFRRSVFETRQLLKLCSIDKLEDVIKRQHLSLAVGIQKLYLFPFRSWIFQKSVQWEPLVIRDLSLVSETRTRLISIGVQIRVHTSASCNKTFIFRVQIKRKRNYPRCPLKETL
jgi:hypothetical protein